MACPRPGPGREVAVKEVAFPAGMPDTERHSAQARVTREARAAARLNHQAVVTLYDVVTHPGGVFLVMELVEAPPWRNWSGSRPAGARASGGDRGAAGRCPGGGASSRHRASRCQAGQRARAASRTAKLADFGVASLAGDPRLTTTGMVIGSPAWRPSSPRRADGPAGRLVGVGGDAVLRGRGPAAVRQRRIGWRPGRGSQPGATADAPGRSAGSAAHRAAGQGTPPPVLWPQGPGLASLAPGGGAISTHRDPPDPQTRSCRAARAATFHLRADPSSRHGGRWPLAAVPEAVGVRARPDSGLDPPAGPAPVPPPSRPVPRRPYRAPPGRAAVARRGWLAAGGWGADRG